MISEADVASLVPDCYAEFRRMVAEGVMFYLEQLSKGRLERVVAEQMGLGAGADAAKRLVRLLHHSPALHKLGQVVARHRELDGGLRRRLQKLETMEPRTPMEEIRPILLRELGERVREYEMEIGQEALAEASVAVVVPFTWREGRGRRAGVLKVLKPGIEEALWEDLEILGKLSDYIDGRREVYGLSAVAYRDTFDEARAILTHEIRLDREQVNLARARQVYGRRRDVLVPEVLRFSTKKMTAMERVYGRKVTEMSGAERGRRKGLAETIVRAMVAEPVLSRAEWAMFHADGHAGNLMASDDGRLAILDWALIGELSRRDREQVLQIVVGGLSGNGARLGRAIEALAMVRPGERTVRPLVERAMAEARRGWPGVRWAMQLLDEAARAGVRFGANLLYFRKAYFTLEGVVGDLCAGCTMEGIITRALLEEFSAEWAVRWLSPMGSREFGTHVSNAEVMEVAAMLPMRLGQWWMGQSGSSR